MKYWKLNVDAIQEMTKGSLKEFNNKIIKLVGDKKIVELIHNYQHNSNSIFGFKLEDGTYLYNSRGDVKESEENPKGISFTTYYALISERELEKDFLIECDDSVKYYNGKKVTIIATGEHYYFARYIGEDEEFLISVDNKELTDQPETGCVVIEISDFPFYEVLKYERVDAFYKTKMGHYSTAGEYVLGVYATHQYHALVKERDERISKFNEFRKETMKSGIFTQENL